MKKSIFFHLNTVLLGTERLEGCYRSLFKFSDLGFYIFLIHGFWQVWEVGKEF